MTRLPWRMRSQPDKSPALPLMWSRRNRQLWITHSCACWTGPTSSLRRT